MYTILFHNLNLSPFTTIVIKMAPNGFKWPQQDLNRIPWIQMDPNGFEWIQMCPNGLKFIKIAINGFKLAILYSIADY